MSARGVTPYRQSRASRSSTTWSQRSGPTTASMDDASSDLDDNLSTLSNTRPPTSRRTRAAASTTTGPLRDQQIICALTESRGISPTVGLAFVNISTAEAVLCQIADNQTYVKTLHKLTVFDPSEILFASFAGGVQKSKLLQVLEGNLTGAAPVRAIHRKYWDETTGVTYVQNLAFIEDVEAIKVSIGGNFYATCCFAAVSRRFFCDFICNFP
jgi:DNA mismatch repair protein MSH4